MTATGVHVSIPINIFKYSPIAFCKLPGTFVLCVEQKACIHVCTGLHIKCTLSGWFIFQNKLNRENIDKGWHHQIPFYIHSARKYL
jgi:hypothetical protein